MLVCAATTEDVPAWLDLAAEVEFLFGPMVDEPGFHAALVQHIAQGSAYCVREDDGGPGTKLMGGLLFSSRPPVYRIGWLSVAEKWRRRGVATVLVEHVLPQITAPAELIVTTFGSDNEVGGPAGSRHTPLPPFNPQTLPIQRPLPLPSHLAIQSQGYPVVQTRRIQGGARNGPEYGQLHPCHSEARCC